VIVAVERRAPGSTIGVVLQRQPCNVALRPGNTRHGNSKSDLPAARFHCTLAHAPDILRVKENFTRRRSMISLSSTFAVAIVGTGRGRGQIGMACCPGRAATWMLPNNSERELTRDVETLARWGTQALVTLLDDVELARLRLHALPGLLSATGITWYRAPLVPARAATPEFESIWSKIGPVLRDTLWQGGKVALHCRDGRDRTGMVAARLLVELGCQAVDAINRVRGARPGAIGSAEQEAYVRRQQAIPEPYEGMQLALLDEDPYRMPPAGWSAAAAFGAAPAATHLQGLPSQLVRTQGVAGAADSK
jgi:protein-tyrosine phosphatase